VIYIIYFSEGERAERVIAVVVHESIVRSVVTTMLCRERIIALKLKAELVSKCACQHQSMKTMELWKCMILLEIPEEDRKGETTLS
jgi:hypothetical protein